MPQFHMQYISESCLPYIRQLAASSICIVGHKGGAEGRSGGASIPTGVSATGERSTRSNCDGDRGETADRAISRLGGGTAAPLCGNPRGMEQHLPAELCLGRCCCRGSRAPRGGRACRADRTRTRPARAAGRGGALAGIFPPPLALAACHYCLPLLRDRRG